MRKGSVLLLLTTAVLLPLTLPSPAWSANRQIVPLNVFADELSAEERGTIDNAIRMELEARPDWDRIDTPDIELIDLMFEADCIEPDVECLAKIGSNLKQPYLLFVSAEPKKGGYIIEFKLVDVTMSALVLSVTRKVKNLAAIEKSVGRAAERLFGKKPAPKVPMGTLVINSSPEGAAVYVNDKRVGDTPVTLKQAPGTYTVRMVKDGYEQRLEEVKVRDEQNTQLTRNLKPVEETPLTVSTDEGREEEDEADGLFYETWWFWSAVGVGVAGIGLGIAAATGAFETDTSPVGNVGFYFTGQADQDYLIQLQRE